MSQIYSKDCFDRFGDDLIEVLLSYISFEDCFQYKCVSKQWKRLIFNKQNELNIINTSRLISLKRSFNIIYLKHFLLAKNLRIKFIKEDNTRNKFKAIELILRNCPNITSVEIHPNLTTAEVNKVFELIIKYCNNLYKIKLNSSNDLAVNTMNRFCNKFGSNLKIIQFCEGINLCPKLLKVCTNLTHLYVNHMKNVFDGNQVLCQKLNSFQFEYRSEDKTRIETFIESNKNSLEMIKVMIFDESLTITERDLKVLFKSIEKLVKLKCFSFTFGHKFDSISFIQLLEILAKNCKQLENIKLCFAVTADLFSKSLFKAINEFKDLKSFTFESFCKFEYNIKSEDLKQLKNLQNFNFRNSLQLTDQFFESIHEYLPHLQTIKSIASTSMTGKTFHSLSLLRNLQKISFSFDSPSLPFDDSVIKQFIENCPTIKSITFGNEKLNEKSN